MTATAVRPLTLIEINSKIKSKVKNINTDFLEIGGLLKEVRDRRLYVDRFGADGFGAYLNAEYDWTLNYGKNLIEAYELHMEHEEDFGDVSMPINAILQFARLRDSKRRCKAILEIRHKPAPTWNDIKAAVDKQLGIYREPSITNGQEEREQPTNEDAEKYFNDPTNFEANVNKVYKAWINSKWGDIMGVKGMQEILIRQALKLDELGDDH